MTVTKKKASESPKTKETKEVPDYFGHRQRLKARFVADMGKTMADYELLELILIYAIPRKDVKPLAKALLRRYSNLASVLAAPLDNLLKNEGVGESVACAALFMPARIKSVGKIWKTKMPRFYPIKN